MVIQRIQSLFILLAIALLVIFHFVPFGYLTETNVLTGVSTFVPLKAFGHMSYFWPGCIAVLLLFVALFSYKTPARQKLLLCVAAMAEVALALVIVYLLVSGFVDATPGDVIKSTTWGGGGLLVIASLISIYGAYRGIVHDEKLLRSADRLR